MADEFEWEEQIFRVRRKKGTHLGRSRNGSGLLSGNTLDDLANTPTGPCELEPIPPNQIKYYLPIVDRSYSKEFQELNYEDRKRIETIRAFTEPIGNAAGMVANHVIDEYVVPGIKKGVSKVTSGVKSLLSKEKKEVVEGEIVDQLPETAQIETNISKKKISEDAAKSKIIEMIIYRQKMQSLYLELQNVEVKTSDGLLNGPDFVNLIFESEESLINSLPEKTVNSISSNLHELELAIRKRKIEEMKSLRTTKTEENMEDLNEHL